MLPLVESLNAGIPVPEAWQQHTFEPDPPIFTSRIWVARHVGAPVDGIVGYARRTSRGDGDVDHVAWSVGTIAAGTGVLMTTYDGTVLEVHSTTAPSDVSTEARTVDDLLLEV